MIANYITVIHNWHDCFNKHCSEQGIQVILTHWPIKWSVPLFVTSPFPISYRHSRLLLVLLVYLYSIFNIGLLSTKSLTTHHHVCPLQMRCLQGYAVHMRGRCSKGFTVISHYQCIFTNIARDETRPSNCCLYWHFLQSASLTMMVFEWR